MFKQDINQLSSNQFTAALLALLAGAALPLAFAPLSLYPIAFISPAILLWVWLKNSAKSAFFTGWLYGIGVFAVGASWVYVSIHRYGNAPMAVALLITALFVIALALFFACQGYLFKKFFPKENLATILLAFPASLVLFEWLRGVLFTGFPWLLLGYSQMATPLKSFAPILGVYGVSLAVAFSAASLVTIISAKKHWQKILALALIVLIWSSALLLNKVNFVTPKKLPPIKVSLVQGNIPQEIKWQESALPYMLNHYLKLTKKNLASKIIVWPEAAIPTTKENVPNFMRKLQTLALKNKIALLTGIPYLGKKTNFYYNALLGLGKAKGLYLKRHLVPFGEYVPMVEQVLTPLANYFDIPLSDLHPGPAQQKAITVFNFEIAPTICYEIAYPELILPYLPKAAFLVTISDDSWFGKSWASAQQLEMAQMRSLEVGRYQLVSTNSGITAIINEKGAILKQAPQFKSYVLNGEVVVFNDATPWVSFGHKWFILLLLIMLALAANKPRKTNHSK